MSAVASPKPNKAGKAGGERPKFKVKAFDLLAEGKRAEAGARRADPRNCVRAESPRGRLIRWNRRAAARPRHGDWGEFSWRAVEAVRPGPRLLMTTNARATWAAGAA